MARKYMFSFLFSFLRESVKRLFDLWHDARCEKISFLARESNTTVSYFFLCGRWKHIFSFRIALLVRRMKSLSGGELREIFIRSEKICESGDWNGKTRTKTGFFVYSISFFFSKQNIKAHTAGDICERNCGESESFEVKRKWWKSAEKWKRIFNRKAFDYSSRAGFSIRKCRLSDGNRNTQSLALWRSTKSRRILQIIHLLKFCCFVVKFQPDGKVLRGRKEIKCQVLPAQKTDEKRKIIEKYLHFHSFHKFQIISMSFSTLTIDLIYDMSWFFINIPSLFLPGTFITSSHISIKSRKFLRKIYKLQACMLYKPHKRGNYRVLIELHTKTNVRCRLCSYQDLYFIDVNPVWHHLLIFPEGYSREMGH